MRPFGSLLNSPALSFPWLVREHATVEGDFAGDCPWQAEGTLRHSGEPYYFRYRFTRVTLQAGAGRKPIILPETVPEALLFYDPDDSGGFAGTLSSFEAATLFLYCLSQLNPLPPALTEAQPPEHGWPVFGETVHRITEPPSGGWCAPPAARCLLCGRDVNEDHNISGCSVPPVPVADGPELTGVRYAVTFARTGPYDILP